MEQFKQGKKQGKTEWLHFDTFAVSEKVYYKKKGNSMRTLNPMKISNSEKFS